jgi:hypothetical protein
LTVDKNERRLKLLLDKIELPHALYKKAKARYSNLNEWLTVEDTKVSNHSPEIFPQGSFRLGTAIYPINPDDAYDLDLGLKLRSGIDKSNMSQSGLRSLVKEDLDKYVKSKNIKDKVETKKRCWCINYQDQISFHMDIVPGIPEDQNQKSLLLENMLSQSVYFNEELAANVSDNAMAITDTERPTYHIISNDWEPSNPQGYALWFDSRVKLGTEALNESVILNKAATIEDLKPYEWNSPLQNSIKLLKRHRDTIYKDPKDHDSKPISIIITTLAANAYQGETSIEDTLTSILDNMDSFINDTGKLIPNPVDANEDFADKWYSKNHNYLDLESNFRDWLKRAKNDFRLLLQEDSKILFESSVSRKFDISFGDNDLDNLGFVKKVSIATPISSNAAPSHLIAN